MAKQNTAAAEKSPAAILDKAAESTSADVTDANENANFSKTVKTGKEEGRVSEIEPGTEFGPSAQTADAEKVAKEQRKSAASEEINSKPAKAVEFDFEGKKYIFLDHAPEVMRIDGGEYSQKEIAENEEIKLYLIGGRSGLIKKIQ